MTMEQRENAYGKILMKYRRGMITYEEMMEKCNAVEAEYLKKNEQQIPQCGCSAK